MDTDEVKNKFIDEGMIEFIDQKLHEMEFNEDQRYRFRLQHDTYIHIMVVNFLKRCNLGGGITNINGSSKRVEELKKLYKERSEYYWLLRI